MPWSRDDAIDPNALPPEKWARWNWRDSGLGRWHAIASWGMGQTAEGETMTALNTACGKLRTLPQSLAHKPDKPVCGDCLQLDALRDKWKHRGAGDAPSDADREPVAVPVGARLKNLVGHDWNEYIRPDPEPGSAEWQDEGLPA